MSLEGYWMNIIRVPNENFIKMMRLYERNDRYSQYSINRYRQNSIDDACIPFTRENYFSQMIVFI